MRPMLHPILVNGRTGDPALYVDFQFERRAVLLDIGDIQALEPRRLLRVSDVFISHGHIDHLIGFDRLLRVLVGRPAHIRIHGPAGIADRIGHKLAGYT
ncbi:MBL fold metallo-hydrolase [Propylenella binzhouense]|uniref:MBL fold metallo-hydrolase n=1 Tax=Propylenella binzhouense TaxID=2555902 RepID=UPI001966F3C9|nr:MBL fold metallo-hydrolase [Propylenella binzhouense]